MIKLEATPTLTSTGAPDARPSAALPKHAAAAASAGR